MPGTPAEDFASCDAIIRTQAQPRGKVPFGLPARHLQPDFADDGLTDAHIDAIDSGQVDAGDAVEFAAQVKLRRMTAGFAAPSWPRLRWRRGRGGLGLSR